MTWRNVESESPDRLVYSERAHPWIGLPLAILGAAGFVGTASQMIAVWPDGFLGSLMGLVVCLFILSAGLGALRRGTIIFDCPAGSVTRSSGLLFWGRSARSDLGDYSAVGWGCNRGSGTSYPVYLSGPDGRKLPLFESSLPPEARRLTEEVAAFLGCGAEHFDEALLAAHAARERPGGRSEPDTLLVRSLVGTSLMKRVVTTDPDRLSYRWGFSDFLVFFGVLALPVGSFFLLLFLLIPDFIMKTPKVWWVFPFLGGVSAACGLLFLFGRRGFAIDKGLRVVRTWWGLLVPLRTRQWEFGRDPGVSLRRRVVVTSGGAPCVVHEVVIRNENGDEVVVFKSLNGHGAGVVGEDVAAFLGRDLVREDLSLRTDRGEGPGTVP